MEEYAVEIIETLTRVVYVEAESEYEALEKVSDMYYSEEIVLDSSDHTNTDYYIFEE